jgi:hypothetical protein
LSDGERRKMARHINDNGHTYTISTICFWGGKSRFRAGIG